MRLRLLLAALAALAVVCLGCGPDPAISGEPGDQGVERWQFEPDPAPTRAPCPESLREELLEPGSPIVLDCDLELEPDDVVRRRLVFAGAASSGVTIRCHGATIQAPETLSVSIRSDCGDHAACVPVHDVELDGCTVRGSIYVFGLAVNGNGSALRRTHSTLDHVRVVRAAAPYRITLRDLDVVGDGPDPIHFGPGVHDSTITDTRILGRSDAVMLYLDAESCDNRMERLTIDASRAGRPEAIAFDGSSGNVLTDSDISGSRDGLRAYRNCGEAGVARHATPSDNLIANNRWDVTGDCIVFGSRGGGQRYCDLDEGVPLGSGQDDRDWSRRNVASGNDCRVRIGDETNTDNEVTE